MTADFTIKANDRLPSIQASLSADLTLAASVKFIMREANADFSVKPGGAVKVNSAATIVNAAFGVVRYDWLAVDTNTPGNYVAEWEVTWTAGTKKQTFPTLTYHSISVLADLDAA